MSIEEKVINMDHMNPDLPQLHSWEAYLVPVTFVVSNFFTLIASLLIFFVIVKNKSLHTTDNFMTLQLVLIDIVFAVWLILYYPTKLATNYYIWNFFTCQLEGGMIMVCGFTWLLSAATIAFYRYRKVCGNLNNRKSDRRYLIFQYWNWLPTITFACLIGVSGEFQIMPSFAYCYLAYQPNDFRTHIYLWITVFTLVIPALLATYFYLAITIRYKDIVLQLIDTNKSEENDLVGKTTNYAASSQSHNEVEENVPKKHLRKVAFKCILYTLVFILSFLPLTCTIVYELVTNTRRSPGLDAICIALVMFHKVMSPIITLSINDPINNKVRRLFRLSATH